MTDSPIRLALVCEDHDAIAHHLETLTSDPSLHMVAVLASTPDLLQWLAIEAVDIVLLELALPESRPLDAVFQIAARAPSTRVIALGMIGERASVDRAIDAGCWGFVHVASARLNLARVIHSVHAGEIMIAT